MSFDYSNSHCAKARNAMRIIAILLILVVLIIMSSCSDKSKSSAIRYKAGTDIAPGEYVITPNQDSQYCSYKISSDSEGLNVISSDNKCTRIYITLNDGEYLEIDGLANPMSNAPKYIPIAGVWSNGMFLVGKDVAAGNYEITPDSSTDMGSYAIMSDPSGKSEAIIKKGDLNYNAVQENQEVLLISLKEGQYIKLCGANMNATDKSDNYITSQWDSNENIPLVTYDDIKSGKYNNSDVKIEGIVTNLEVDNLINYVNFDVWFQSGNKLVCYGYWSIDKERTDETIYNRLSQNFQEGQHCLFTVNIYENSSFGSFSLRNIEFTERVTPLDVIKESYIQNCIKAGAADVARNPDNFKGVDVAFSGEVLQIVEEKDNAVELLLDTGGENGIVYVEYTIPKGESRILKGDHLTVYGTFYAMKSYASVLMTSQNVPSITAKFIHQK